MADDKTIVTKKTAPKAAATTKKTAAKKTATTAGAAAPSAARKAAPATSAAPKAQMKPSATPAKAAPAKELPAKEAAAPRRSKKTDAPQKSMEGKAISLKTLSNVSDEERLHMVHEAAYYRAEKRSFVAGHEAEDWAEAEREINELIASAKRISGR